MRKPNPLIVCLLLIIILSICITSDIGSPVIAPEFSQAQHFKETVELSREDISKTESEVVMAPSLSSEKKEQYPIKKDSEFTTPTAEEAPKALETVDIAANERLREIDGTVEVLIPAGEFFFGCDPQHNGSFECLPDELPLQKQYLETFAIDKFEVTNVQYARCVATGACEEPVYTYSATRESYFGDPAYANYPVSGISWNEAYAYCTWVGGRLPTEAEWEKAARGERMRAYPWGDEEPNCNLANSRDDRLGVCVGDTAPVGSYPLGASPYGVMDMAGNVWEWVMDYYVHDYSGHLINLDPLTEGVVYKRIIKGGSFDYNSYTMRIAYNSDHNPTEHKISFGFRCMRPME